MRVVIHAPHPYEAATGHPRRPRPPASPVPPGTMLSTYPYSGVRSSGTRRGMTRSGTARPGQAWQAAQGWVWYGVVGQAR